MFLPSSDYGFFRLELKWTTRPNCTVRAHGLVYNDPRQSRVYNMPVMWFVTSYNVANELWQHIEQLLVDEGRERKYGELKRSSKTWAHDWTNHNCKIRNRKQTKMWIILTVLSVACCMITGFEYAYLINEWFIC